MAAGSSKGHQGSLGTLGRRTQGRAPRGRGMKQKWVAAANRWKPQGWDFLCCSKYNTGWRLSQYPAPQSPPALSDSLETPRPSWQADSAVRPRERAEGGHVGEGAVGGRPPGDKAAGQVARPPGSSL